MSVSTWKYVKKLRNNKNIGRFEDIVERILPNDYKETVALYNGGRPDKSSVKVDSRERVFKSLLSFNTEDKENIFDVHKWLESKLHKNLVPFAIDPAGNYFCFDYKNSDKMSVVYWNHENQSISKICNNFSELLEELY